MRISGVQIIKTISESITLITEEDRTLDLFESKYPIPDGVTYNSYVIDDGEIAVLDTMDSRMSEEWFSDLCGILAGRSPDYLVVHHMEPDHAANVARLAEMYPSMRIVGTSKAFEMMTQFFGVDYGDRKIAVGEGDSIDIGEHSLKFIMAPMVHWPEVMMSYESKEHILFTADGFGRFGPADPDYDWVKGARRYYFNIVGKYGSPVQKVLSKASGLEISKICPLHGPVLDSDIGRYVSTYDVWSRCEPETEDVLIAYTSIYGNTRAAVCRMAEELKKNGLGSDIMDLARVDISYALEGAFTHRRIVLATTTYEGGVFPAMDAFISELSSKKLHGRIVGIIENGSWSPMAGAKISKVIESMADMKLCQPMVTLRSAMTDKSIEQIRELAVSMSNSDDHQ